MAIGAPGTRKTLLFGGINVSIRTNNMLKSITMYGIILCDRHVCGEAIRESGNEYGRITFIPTSKVAHEIYPVEPVIAHRLSVPKFSSGYSQNPFLSGPGNQLLVNNGQSQDTYFYTLADGTAVLEPTKTEKLQPIGGAGSGNQYSYPVFYDGTQLWLRCRCGYDYDIISSLDYNTKWTLGSDERRLDNGLVSANNVLWFQDSRDNVAAFSLYDISTRTFLRKFNTFEHSPAAKSFFEYNRSVFALSLDGSILYLVNYQSRPALITILGTHILLLYVICVGLPLS